MLAPLLLLTLVVAADLPATRAALDAEHRERMEGIAARCEGLGLAEQAAATRAWPIRRDAGRQYLFLVPESDPLAPAAGAELPVQQWHAAVTRERQRFAAALLALARESLAADQLETAYQLVHETLREDPDQADARRILGYRRDAARWFPAREPTAARATAPQPRLGWRGGGYWRIESDHYRIATNAGREEGLALAARLEELHSCWRQLFVRYWTDAGALDLWFRGPALGSRGGGQKHQVVLFADRQQYVAHLKKIQPRIELTEGIYLDRERTAYFFGGGASFEATCFHEGTHQLFHESGRVAADVGGQANFWIVEGIALYMESLARQRGCFTVGGLDASRLQFARNWALSGAFHLPATELARLGRQPLQEHPQIREIYSQAAGMTHLLMDGGGGAHRPALAVYLNRVYTGRAEPTALFDLTRRSGVELDRDYLAFLQVSDNDLAQTRLLSSTRHLCLGRTAVTDEGLAELARLRELVWLDLSFTRCGDATVARLAGHERLTQLNLEQTATTDAGLEALSKLTQLEELDLSQTAVTDAGLVHLAGLKNLKTLWLTGTKVTDEGLAQLRGLTQLATLDLSGTRVTPAGIAELRRMLPRWKE